MLKGIIKFANKEYDSIEGVLRAFYNDKKADSDLATYRGKIICLDIEEENEEVSMYENVALQLKDIDISLEV